MRDQQFKQFRHCRLVKTVASASGFRKAPNLIKLVKNMWGPKALHSLRTANDFS